MTKTCTTCGEVKPLTEFHRDRSHRDGLGSSCRPCHADRMRAWRKANAARFAESLLRSHLKKYGITPDEYRALLEKQNGVCAVCGGPPVGQGKRLHVDHCHETGIVRGLLCTLCNNGLGNFRDDPERLQKAIAYLKS